MRRSENLQYFLRVASVLILITAGCIAGSEDCSAQSFGDSFGGPCVSILTCDNGHRYVYSYLEHGCPICRARQISYSDLFQLSSDRLQLERQHNRASCYFFGVNLFTLLAIWSTLRRGKAAFWRIALLTCLVTFAIGLEKAFFQ